MLLIQMRLTVNEVLRCLVGALKDVFSRAPTAAMLFDRYAKLALVVDEVINEVSKLIECFTLHNILVTTQHGGY